MHFIKLLGRQHSLRVFYEAWRTKGRRAVSIDVIGESLWASTFPHRTNNGRDIQFFDLARAVLLSYRNQTLLPARWGVTNCDGNPFLGTAFCLDVAVLAFDVFHDDLEPIVETATKYHRVPEDWRPAITPAGVHRTPGKLAFAEAINSMAGPSAAGGINPLDGVVEFSDWVLRYPFLQAFMRCRPSAHVTVDSYIGDLRDEFKRTLTTFLVAHGISRHSRRGGSAPGEVPLEWRNLKARYPDGPLDVAVAPVFSTIEMLEFAQIARGRGDMGVLAEMTDWLLFRLREKPTPGPLRSREEVFNRHANLVLGLLRPQLRDIESRAKKTSTRIFGGADAQLLRAIFELPHALIAKLDLASVLEAPKENHGAAQPVRVPSPTKKILAAVSERFESGRAKTRGPRTARLLDESAGGETADDKRPQFTGRKFAGYITLSELASMLECSPETLRSRQKARQIVFESRQNEDDNKWYAVIVDSDEAIAQARATLAPYRLEPFAKGLGVSPRTIRRDLVRRNTDWETASRHPDVLKDIALKYVRRTASSMDLTICVSAVELTLVKELDFAGADDLLASATPTEDGIHLTGSRLDFESLGDSLASCVAAGADDTARSDPNATSKLRIRTAQQLALAISKL